MRITRKEKENIIRYAKKYFGADVKMYLFGSRVDDKKKGGDIDLFLESKIDINMYEQIEFLKQLYLHITTRKIDLVIKSPSKKDRPIYHTAKKEGILLC